MKEPLNFKTREEFRNWLYENALSSDGVWLIFGKTKELVTVKANEALEEALCFGWIDGLMKKLDDNSYIKYFSARRKDSKWSAKNKLLAEKLEMQGFMTEFGRTKIEEAKQNGQWKSADKQSSITEEQINRISKILKTNQQAYLNFEKMPPSVKKTYTRAYFDAKTDAGKEKRLEWMIARLEKNLKPM